MNITILQNKKDNKVIRCVKLKNRRIFLVYNTEKKLYSLIIKRLIEPHERGQLHEFLKDSTANVGIIKDKIIITFLSFSIETSAAICALFNSYFNHEQTETN